jgi:NADH dehydrogenase
MLPRSVAVDVAVSSFNDERGLRAAMVDVDTIYHLASGEWRGPRTELIESDIRATRAVVDAAEDAGVRRIFYVSHLGADRASAYPVLKAKGIAEEFVKRSKLDFTILRSAILYGPNDRFTTGLARVLGVSPLFIMPGNGKTVLQPLWVEDLVTCLIWALDDPETIDKVIDVGGPEYLTFQEIVRLVMQETGLKRALLHLPPPYVRGLTVTLESMIHNLPTTVYWLDYMAVNRTTALDTMPRAFDLMPSRMSQRLAYLRDQNWRTSLFRALRERRV